MILTDREIKKALAKKLVVIDPEPAADAYASTSVDLTLDPLLKIFRIGTGVIIDPGMPGYKVKELLDGATDALTITSGGWDFPPGKLVLGWTKERVELNLEGQPSRTIVGRFPRCASGLRQDTAA